MKNEDVAKKLDDILNTAKKAETEKELGSAASDIESDTDTESATGMGATEKEKSPRVKTVADNLLSIALRSSKLAKLESKLKNLSPVEQMKVLELAVKNYQLLTGGATHRTEVNYTSKQELLDKLRGIQKQSENSNNFKSDKNKLNLKKKNELNNNIEIGESKVEKLLKMPTKSIN